MKKHKTIIIFFGPPGSGKGTQAKLLSQRLSLPVISPGELLRQEQEKKTETGKKVSSRMAKGELVGDEIVSLIIDKRLGMDDTKNGFMLDGYPRRKSQLIMLKNSLDQIAGNQDKIIAVYVDASDKSIIGRIAGRLVCGCGASYHTKTNPPKMRGICDKCGSKLHQRQDDKGEVIKHRLEDFHRRIKPLIKYFKDNYSLIVVDGDKRIKEVEKEVWQKYKKLI